MCQVTGPGKNRTLRTARSSSLYEVLGVDRDAGPGEIQRAYRRLVRRCHPDVTADPTAAERFREIAEAYEVLSDPQRRRQYDAADRAPRQGSARRAGRGPTGDFWSWRPQGQDPRSWSGGIRRTGLRADPDLGGPGAARRRGQEIEVPLTLEEAYRGARRSVTLSLPEGRRTVAVDIPAGMVDGQRLRLTGGGVGSGGHGDLYLVVQLAPHPVYQVRRRDVTVDLPLTPWEAALGATVSLVTPEGGRTGLRVPPATSSGQVLRVRGLGVPHPGGAPGDLFAVARIVVPGSLGPHERRLLERLAAASTFQPRAGARA